MRYPLVILIIALCITHTSTGIADELTGDTGQACEALLCLSSGTRPTECTPSLLRYFSIVKKKWDQTLSARRDFLNLCPTSSDEGVPSLVDAIVNGAGQCDADTLNSSLSRQIVIRVCDNDKYWLEEEERCYDKIITIIDNNLPYYCDTYAKHQYTYKIGVHYEGEIMNGGRWVNE